MKKLFLLTLLLSLVATSAAAAGLATNLKGKILLQVEQNGEAWYVNPADEKRYFMGRPEDAFGLMRDLGVGINNEHLEKIQIAQENMGGDKDSDNDGLSDSFEDAIGTNKNSKDSDGDGYDDKTEVGGGYNPNGNGKLNIDNSFATAQAGRILLQVERNGEAWYVNPENKLRYYLGRPADAFNVMRRVGLGVTDSNLVKIQEGKGSLSAPSVVNNDIAATEENDVSLEVPQEDVNIEIDEECSQYDEALQEACMVYKEEDGDYANKLDKMEEELSDYRTFTDKLYDCEGFSYIFAHPFTGEDIRRGVVGFDKEGECVQYEDVPSAGMMLCKYSDTARKEVADYYKTQSPFAFSFSVNIKLSGDDVEVENNEEVNPLQEAMDSGACTISLRNESKIENLLLKKEYLVSKEDFNAMLEESITKKNFDSFGIAGNNEYVIDSERILFAYWDDYSVKEVEEGGVMIYQLHSDSSPSKNGHAAVVVFDLNDESIGKQEIIDEVFYQHINDALNDYDLNMDYYYLETDSGLFFFYEDNSGNNYVFDGAVSMVDDNRIVVVMNDQLSKEEYVALVQSIKINP